MRKGDSRYPDPEELERRQQIERREAETQEDARSGFDDPPAISGLVVWLARRLGEDPHSLARRWPADTLRRTKYPFASEALEDGSTRFRSVGLIEDKQLIHAPTTPGSNRDWMRGGIEVKR